MPHVQGCFKEKLNSSTCTFQGKRQFLRTFQGCSKHGTKHAMRLILLHSFIILENRSPYRKGGSAAEARVDYTPTSKQSILYSQSGIYITEADLVSLHSKRFG